jgi:hypothetical protein
MANAAIQQDAAQIDAITAEPGEDAEAAFLRHYAGDENLPEGDEEPKKNTPKAPKANEEIEETSEETPEETEDDSEGEPSEDDETEADETEEEPAGKRVVLEPDADAVIKHKVDGKEIEIPVKDLTRLYGQEAALTRKSQETAELKKTVEADSQRYTAGLDTMLQRAVERFKPYANIDFLVLSKDPDISAQDLQSLRTQAQAAYEDVNFLQSQLNDVVQKQQHARHNTLVQQAQESWKVLSNEDTGIKGWNEEKYNDIRQYALKAGLAKDVVNELVDPVAIKMLHKAMLFDKGEKALVTTKKVAHTPSKIIKSTPDNVLNKTKGKPVESALAKLKRTGSQDDAADAFLAMMQA